MKAPWGLNELVFAVAPEVPPSEAKVASPSVLKVSPSGTKVSQEESKRKKTRN
jgi:hypothetical protein